MFMHGCSGREIESLLSASAARRLANPACCRRSWPSDFGPCEAQWALAVAQSTVVFCLREVS